VHPVNRIEIIASSQEAEKIIKVLEKVDAPNYTLIRNVIGKGDWGMVSDDVNLGSSELGNIFIICYCSQDTVKPIVENIKPLLNKYGGVCYISDAMEIRSVRCIASL
jgi:nitrogen regulatory protein PII